MFRPLAILASLACMLALPAFAQDAQPSFDCAKAASPVEHAVCGNAALAALDADLANAYKQALAKSADADALRLAQRAWSNERSATCGLMPGADDDIADVSEKGLACLIDLYRNRLAQLTDVNSLPAATDAASRLTGLWQLSDVIEATNPALTKEDQKGRLIRLDRHALGTLDGAGCAGPTLQPLAEARARPLDAEEQALISKADAAGANILNGIAGFCLGRLFALYLPGDDGSLLVADASALYRLQRLSGGNP